MKNMNTKKGIRGFQVVEEECIWMKAGVVSLHTCNKLYDCFDCKFDKAMTRAMGARATQETASNWAAFFKKKYDGASRPCRHVVTGRIQQPKICTHNYECHDCSFDQMLDDIEISRAQSRPELVSVAGFDLARDYYYHEGHTWVRMEHGGMARIGFDAFVMKLFGQSTFNPEMNIGSHMEKGESGWTITQDHQVAKVLSPISGTILSVNQRVKKDALLLHDDPYQDGWLFIVEPDAPLKNLRKLKFGDASIRWMEKENSKLIKLMGPEYENLAATGGEPVNDFYGLNPEIGWDKLVRTFLKT